MVAPLERRKSFRDYTGVYRPLTYPTFLMYEWVQRLWRRFMCPCHMHLFSAVLSSGGYPFHYLVCDPCQLMVCIEGFDTRFEHKHAK